EMGNLGLTSVISTVPVYARVSPAHKLEIVQALQQQGEIVAMTGDGVNDAPALRKADIGVAMGITGTDVSKEAADMVLLDDNFATIVAAIREGRIIFENIRRFVKFSIAGNLGKVLVMLVAPLLGMAVPLLPLQLLWLNLLTDGLLALGIGVEPREADTMKQPPRSPAASIFSDGLGRNVLWVGLLIGLLTLGLGYYFFDSANKVWQTMMFTALAFAQIGQALASRSARQSLWQLGLWSNPTLLLLVLLTAALQLVAIYLPALDQFFEVEPLSAGQLFLAILAGVATFAALEAEKWWRRQRE
ncbi:MAG: HAD-IC family P-type ATPase, partial [Anaerolineales bacterium]|nr:HAD-IC family P-type ATPase [Anaerolineales bacterium]